MWILTILAGLGLIFMAYMLCVAVGYPIVLFATGGNPDPLKPGLVWAWVSPLG